jgi:hypothetical protein
MGLEEQLAACEKERDTFKTAYLEQVELHNKTLDELAACEKDRDELRMGLENCRLLAARHRKEDWALLILGFCAEAGVVGSVTR